MSDKEREDKMMKGMDAFINAVTGAGYSHDSSTYTMFNRGGDLSEQLLEDLYIDHDLAATIVDRIVRDALRSGYEINWEGATDQKRFDVVDWAEAEYGDEDRVLLPQALEELGPRASCVGLSCHWRPRSRLSAVRAAEPNARSCG